MFSCVSNSDALSDSSGGSLKLKLVFDILPVNVKEYPGNGTFLILTSTFLSQLLMPMLLIPSHNTLSLIAVFIIAFFISYFFPQKVNCVKSISISVSFINKSITCDRAQCVTSSETNTVNRVLFCDFYTICNSCHTCRCCCFFKRRKRKTIQRHK